MASLKMIAVCVLWLTSATAFATIDVPSDERARGPLPPAQAFALQVLASENDAFTFVWHIQPWYYLYVDKLTFTPSDPNYQITTKFSPRNTQSFTDAFFGEVEIYRQLAEVELIVSKRQTNKVSALNEAQTNTDDIHGNFLQNLVVQVGYQGCWDGGICYPPQTLDVRLADAFVSAQSEANPFSSTAMASASAYDSNQLTSENATISKKQSVPSFAQFEQIITNQEDQYAFISLLQNTQLWLVWMVFYLVGIALAFSPCVYPTIPLVGGLITRQAKQLSVVRGFSMVGVYVLCMSLTYAMVGIAAGMLGSNLQALLQQQWIILVSAGFFVVFSGAMFGLYPLQLPGWLARRMHGISGSFRSSGYAELGIMGIFSALIISPCLTAPLAGILIFLANHGDPTKAGASLFALGLGMGTPLIVLSLFAGKLLPKAGTWMHTINHMFGFALLFVAVWMLERIFSERIILLLYAMVVLALASYLWQVVRGAIQRQHQWREIMVRSLSIALFAIGIANIFNFALPHMFRDYISVAQVNDSITTQVRVTTPFQLQQQLLRLQGKPIMLKYEADWCIECRVIEREVMQKPQIRQKLQSIQTLVIDVTQTNSQSNALLARYAIPGPPALVFYHTDGNELAQLRLVGNITVPILLQRLRKLGV